MSRLTIQAATISVVCMLSGLTAVSCGGGSADSSPTGVTSGVGSISVSATPSAVDVQPGQTVVTVRITRSGFTGPVTLSLTGAPTGVSASFSRATIPADSTSALLLLDIGTNAAPGTYVLTLSASGQGLAGATASVSLTVRAPQATGSFAITTQPASISIARGANGTATVRITRTNLTGVATLAVSGAPAGVTATVSPTSVAGDSAQLTMSVGGAATLGPFTLTVTGTIAGQNPRTTTLQLTVLDAPPSSAVQWAQISAGFAATCGVSTTGTAYCWGAGIVGTGTASANAPQTTPRTVPGGRTWKEVRVGSNACGVTTAGDGYCWGNGAGGGLGNGTTADQLAPTLVAGGHKWITIDPGFLTTCGLTTSGTAYCWGSPSFLGSVSTTVQLLPTAVDGGFTFASLSNGNLGACGVTTSRQAVCWTPVTAANTVYPAVTPGGQSWSTVSSGNTFHCGITTAGTAFCLGLGAAGELGNGTTTDKDSWTLVAGSQTWSQISAGKAGAVNPLIGPHTCGVTTAGDAFCWGTGGSGELGDGQTISRTTPVQVVGGRKWTHVSAGGGHTCGVTTAGEAYCWGFGFVGALGNGTQTASNTPVRVSNPQ